LKKSTKSEEALTFITQDPFPDREEHTSETLTHRPLDVGGVR